MKNSKNQSKKNIFRVKTQSQKMRMGISTTTFCCSFSRNRTQQVRNIVFCSTNAMQKHKHSELCEREKIPLNNEQNFETSNSAISVSPNKLSKLSPTLPSQNSHAHPYKPEASWVEMNYLSKMEGYPLPSQAPFAGTGTM